MADDKAPIPVVSNVMQSLPLREVFAAPLVAAIEAHNTACNALEVFITKVGCDEKTGEIKNVNFKYSQDEPSGKIERTIQVPLISILPLPSFGVDKVTVDFDVKVDATESTDDSDGKEGGVDAGVGWGPVSVKLHGSLSHKSEQTRKSDTSARYTVHMEASRQPMPEAFSRVIDALLAHIKPKETPTLPAAASTTSSTAIPAAAPTAAPTAAATAPAAAVQTAPQTAASTVAQPAAK